MVDWSIYIVFGQIKDHYGQIKHYNGQNIIQTGQIIKPILDFDGGISKTGMESKKRGT